MTAVYVLLSLAAFVGVFSFFIQRGAKALIKPLERYEAKLQAKIDEDNNPYIQYQKQKDANGKQYQQYLEWMQKNSEGIPLDKMKFKEDEIAKKKIKGLF